MVLVCVSSSSVRVKVVSSRVSLNALGMIEREGGAGDTQRLSGEEKGERRKGRGERRKKEEGIEEKEEKGKGTARRRQEAEARQRRTVRAQAQ